MSLEPRPVGVEPRPADGPAFVLCFQHVSINIIFLSPFAAFPLPHSDQLQSRRVRLRARPRRVTARRPRPAMLAIAIAPVFF